MTSTAEPATALTFPALPSGSTRRGSSSISPGWTRTSGGSRTRWTSGGSPSGRTPRPTRASIVARRQLAAGARGITVGTIGEAEVFAEAGIDDLFLAYPIWAGGSKGDRVRALHERLPAFRVGVDSADGARRLAEAVDGARRSAHASSSRSIRACTGRACRRRTSPSRSPGRRATPASRSSACSATAATATRPELRSGPAPTRSGRLTAAAEALRAAGFEVTTISAGATPTILSAAAGAVNEMRAGT